MNVMEILNKRYNYLDEIEYDSDPHCSCSNDNFQSAVITVNVDIFQK